MIRLVQMIATSGALATGVLTLIYFPEIKEALTHENKTRLTEESDLRLARRLLELKRPLEASKLIQSHLSQSSDPSQLQKWLPLFIEASDELGDSHQLVLIYRHNPSLVAQNESASLKTASELLAQKDWQSYETLKALSSPHRNKESWLLTDADSLILQGKSSEALTLLQSRILTGKEETQRLLRLSLLQIHDHPKLAWEPLHEASQKATDELEVRYFKARFLETSGKELLAESEYRTLSQSPESTPFLDREVADFYLRQNNYNRAVKSLEIKLKEGASPELWVKALFLGKVYEPLVFEANSDPKMQDSPFLSYLLKLPPDRFWDEALFSKVAQSQTILATYEEAFWLRILENIQKGYERDAYTLLENPPLTLSEKELASTLQALLNYRLKGDLTVPTFAPNSDLRDFFSSVSADKSEAFLKGPDAFPSLFLVKGWSGAAMKLFKKTPPDASTPDEIVLIRALLLYNQGSYEAMRELLQVRPELNNSVKGQELLARAYLKEGKLEEAKETYAGIEESSSEAKSFLAKQAFDERDFQRALNLTKALLQENPNNPLLQNNLKHIMESAD